MHALKSLERRLLKLATSKAEESVLRKLAAYDNKPVPYATEYLGQILTPKQRDILELLDKPPYRVLARSANSQGKTFVAALKCSHFFDTKRPSITLATAPTAKSVQDLLFKELRRLRPGDRQFSPIAARLQASPEHYVDGYTSADPDAFQGRHDKHMGFVFDEATGIAPAFWERGETMFESNGNHWWLATYNPNDTSSQAHIAEESGKWHVVELSALEHPNVLAGLRGEEPPIPGAVTLSTVIRRMSQECEEVDDPDEAIDFKFGNAWWRPKTPGFEAQILGRWPVTPTASLLSPAEVEKCYETVHELVPDRRISVGCDVARHGDDKTVIAVTCGSCLLRIEEHSKRNLPWVTERLRGIIAETLSALNLDLDLARTIPTYVDATGGLGAGVVDYSDGYNFIEVNNSERSPDPKYTNTRNYLWGSLAFMVQNRLLDWSRLGERDRLQLKQELTSARYSYNTAGQKVIDTKDTIKKRLRRSPDRADAVALAYYGFMI